MFRSEQHIDVAVLGPPRADTTRIPIGIGLAAERGDAEVNRMNAPLGDAVTAFEGGKSMSHAEPDGGILEYQLEVASGSWFGSETSLGIWCDMTEEDLFDGVVTDLLDTCTEDRNPRKLVRNQDVEADLDLRFSTLARNVDILIGVIPGDSLTGTENRERTEPSSTTFDPAGVPGYQMLYRSSPHTVVPVVTDAYQLVDECDVAGLGPAVESDLRAETPSIDRLMRLTDEQLYPVNLLLPDDTTGDPAVEGYVQLLDRLRQ